jgi:hypothetical protein
MKVSVADPSSYNAMAQYIARFSGNGTTLSFTARR